MKLNVDTTALDASYKAYKAAKQAYARELGNVEARISQEWIGKDCQTNPSALDTKTMSLVPAQHISNFIVHKVRVTNQDRESGVWRVVLSETDPFARRGGLSRERVILIGGEYAQGN